MAGTYNTYFRNIKRKGKVIFDYSTTLSLNLDLGTGHKLQGEGWAEKIRGWVTVFMHVKRGGGSKSHAH